MIAHQAKQCTIFSEESCKSIMNLLPVSSPNKVYNSMSPGRSFSGNFSIYYIYIHMYIQLYQHIPFLLVICLKPPYEQPIRENTELLTLNAFIAAHGRWWDDDRRRSLDEEMVIPSNFFLRNTGGWWWLNNCFFWFLMVVDVIQNVSHTFIIPWFIIP